MHSELQKIAKKYLPVSVFEIIRFCKHAINLKHMYKQQTQRFLRYSSIGIAETKDQLAAVLIYNAHRIEKGLSHSDFRPMFGQEALQALSKCLRSWLDKEYSNDAFEFRLALSALKAYEAKHLQLGYDASGTFKAYFSDMRHMINDASDSLSGTITISAEVTGKDRYGEVLARRHSIREYGPGIPEHSRVVQALSIAMNAPSVCNRQSQRVTIVTDPKKVHKILDAQGGWRGYEYPPMLLIVSSSLASFVSSTERNEPYVDGGIFTMALLGAIEYVGLASCPLNAMFELSNERVIRKVAGIPEGEVMVVIVTLGNKPDTALCPRSTRKGADDVIRYV